ncbi:MAG: DUF2130 domain-containing protein [Marinilabiliales bacterium]|nr:DUF2130 domain-containing protein [Marinilabiliales bacterium]
MKADALTVKADVLVIITEALPEGIEKIGQKDGIWICTFFDFKGLVIILRESLIKISEAFSSQTNKGEKMQMLYDYSGKLNEFMMQISGELSKAFQIFKIVTSGRNVQCELDFGRSVKSSFRKHC